MLAAPRKSVMATTFRYTPSPGRISTARRSPAACSPITRSHQLSGSRLRGLSDKGWRLRAKGLFRQLQICPPCARRFSYHPFCGYGNYEHAREPLEGLGWDFVIGRIDRDAVR